MNFGNIHHPSNKKCHYCNNPYENKRNILKNESKTFAENDISKNKLKKKIHGAIKSICSTCCAIILFIFVIFWFLSLFW